MINNKIPTLYSFRRCPYAMRARMAIHISGQKCELRFDENGQMYKSCSD